MQYTKKDATMTKGLAILAMLVLHLFCREGSTVLGTPLLWFTETVPVVAWAGFFSEYCMALYSICAGYGYYLLAEKGKNNYKNRLARILNLLIIYWIIVCVFSLLGLFFDKSASVPGSLGTFVLNLLLIKSYVGAWWYLPVYVILLLLPSFCVLFVAKKFRFLSGSAFCIVVQVGVYFIGKFGFHSYLAGKLGIPPLVYNKIFDLLKIVPYVWLGTLFCRDNVISVLDSELSRRCTMKQRKLWFVLSWIGLFVAFNLVHKAVLVGLETIWIFLTFNLYEKSSFTKKCFLFLGKHSTNIWLVHMFFYSRVFTGLVEIVRYPLFMLAFMLVLCITSSYIILFIRDLVRSCTTTFKRIINA